MKYNLFVYIIILNYLKNFKIVDNLQIFSKVYTIIFLTYILLFVIYGKF